MAASESHSTSLQPDQRRLLLAAAAVSSSCGLAAELLLGTLTSYLVGNAALAYGVAVGGFLAAMGLGAYLSQLIAVTTTDPRSRQQQLLASFFGVELLMAPLTALLPLGLFWLFVVNGPLWLGLVLVTLILGLLAGIEVPLLTRIIEQDQGVGAALAGVLALDYLGALLGSLAFPVVLLPTLGLFPTAALIGSLPAWMVWAIARHFKGYRHWSYAGLALGLSLWLLIPLALPLGDRLENQLYRAPIVTRLQSAYQRLVLTRNGTDLRLFLDGNLQLSTLDEYRYHEALVHPALSASPHPRRVLLLGAGDGMALREVLKWPQVERVVLVELDPMMVKLARHHPLLARANHHAYDDPRLEVLLGDAFTVAPHLDETFDVIIADFPDPDREAIAKLYTKGFYQGLLSRLTADGLLVTQASSPFFAPLVLDCITTTLRAVGLFPHPYVADVPSFGPWGFVLASRDANFANFEGDRLHLTVPTRFLTSATLPNLFQLPGDVVLGQAEVNLLTHPVILGYQQDSRWQGY